MRPLLALLLALLAPTPASAGRWEPTRSFGPYGHVAVAENGSSLIGRPAWNYDAERSEVRYTRVGVDGTLGPQVVAGFHDGTQYGAEGRGWAHPTVFDRGGNATLVFSFRDDSNYGGELGCCPRYEVAQLPRGATEPIARERIEPSGRDGTGLGIAVAPDGARVGAWLVVRPRKPNRLVQVLDAPAGHRFGRPLTIADEPVQSAVRVVAERGKAAWIVWTTEQESADGVSTEVRVARRRANGLRWRVRTIARSTLGADEGLRIEASSLDVAAGRDGELLVGWAECDGDGRYRTVSCQVRVRWRGPGTWEPAQTVGAPGISAHADIVMDRRGHAVLAFDNCQPDDRGTWPGRCTLQIARGARGTLGPLTDAGPGLGPVLAANRRGDVALLYQTGIYGDDDYAHYLRAGSTVGDFGPPERYGIGYATGLTGFGMDGRGNASFTYAGLDPDRTTLYRYRR